MDAHMTKQDFYEYQTNVDATAVAYRNLPGGKCLVIFRDGDQVLIASNGNQTLLRAQDRLEVARG